VILHDKGVMHDLGGRVGVFFSKEAPALLLPLFTELPRKGVF
jgi:hypothetical protein